MARHYGKRMGGHRRSFFGMGKKKSHGDNPKIRHSHLEHREINLGQEWEVRHAEQVGAIKIEKNGGIHPVKGKAYTRGGHLFYIAPPAEHVEHRKAEHHHEGGRHITEEARKKWDANAKKGSEKWHLMPHAERVERRRDPKGKWGFEGQSPNTRNRKN